MRIIDANEIRKGKWLPYGMCGDYKCSECGFEDERESKFCPDCGARMSHFVVRTMTWEVVGEQE